jgi:hypothetical protein
VRGQHHHPFLNLVSNIRKQARRLTNLLPFSFLSCRLCPVLLPSLLHDPSLPRFPLLLLHSQHDPIFHAPTPAQASTRRHPSSPRRSLPRSRPRRYLSQFLQTLTGLLCLVLQTSTQTPAPAQTSDERSEGQGSKREEDGHQAAPEPSVRSVEVISLFPSSPLPGVRLLFL